MFLLGAPTERERGISQKHISPDGRTATHKKETKNTPLDLDIAAAGGEYLLEYC
jgi:hypothetical protein